MPYVGHRPILPAGDDEHKETQLLEDVGDPALPDHSDYARHGRMTQVVNGEFTYNPMEVDKFSPFGQSVPYVRHANYEFHGVESAEVFPKNELESEAAPAVIQGGTITLADWSTATGAPFTFDVNGVTLSVDGDYSAAALVDLVNDIADLIAASDLAGDVIVDENDANDGIKLSSVEVGADASVQTAENAQLALPEETATGTDAEYTSFWGHDGTRNLSTSRHTNYTFEGVASSDATLEGHEPRYFGDEDVPSGFGRIQPFVNQGVTEQPLEDPGDDSEDAFQPHVWKGVDSAKAL